MQLLTCRLHKTRIKSNLILLSNFLNQGFSVPLDLCVDQQNLDWWRKVDNFRLEIAELDKAAKRRHGIVNAGRFSMKDLF
jgi:hypothetical protein